MSSEIKIRQLTTEAIPLLESGLKEQPLLGNIERELQLRATNCGLATAALQQWLREERDTDTERLLLKADLNVVDISRSRRISHVVLRTLDGLYIDPTHSQFLSHIGLTHRTAVEQNKTHLYPAEKVAVFADTEKFAEAYAQHVHYVDQEGGIEAGQFEIGADGAFRGADEAMMRDFYGRLWSPNAAEAFPLETQNDSFQKTARAIATSMKQK